MLLWTLYSLTHFWNDHKFQSPGLLSPFHTCACVDTHTPVHSMLSSGFYKSLATGLRWQEGLTAPFPTVFPSQLQRDGYKHVKEAKNIKMLELIPYGLFRWHQIPAYSQRDIWVQLNNQRSSSVYTHKNKWSSSYCPSVHSLSMFSKQSWARDDSRVVEVLMILSGSNSALLLLPLLSPVLLSSSGAGQVVANRGAGTWDVPQHHLMGCQAEFWFWVEVALWKTSDLRVLGAFLSLSRKLTHLKDTLCR